MRLVERSSVFQAPRHSRQSIRSCRIKAGSVGNTAAAVGFCSQNTSRDRCNMVSSSRGCWRRIDRKMASIKRKIDPIQSAHGSVQMQMMDSECRVGSVPALTRRASSQKPMVAPAADSFRSGQRSKHRNFKVFLDRSWPRAPHSEAGSQQTTTSKAHSTCRYRARLREVNGSYCTTRYFEDASTHSRHNEV